MLEGFKEKRSFHLNWDVYELNKNFYSNSALILAGTLIYMIYYSTGGDLSGLFGKNINLNMINQLLMTMVSMLYVTLFVMLITYSANAKTGDVYVIGCITLCCLVVGAFNLNLIMNMGNVQIQYYGYVSGMLITLEQILYLAGMYFLLRPDVDGKRSRKKSLIYYLGIPSLLIVLVGGLRLAIDAGIIKPGQSVEIKFLLLILNFAVLIISLYFAVNLLYTNGNVGRNGVSRSFSIGIAGVFIIFIINQLILLNRLMESDTGLMMFQIFKVMGMAMLIRTVFKEYIVGTRKNSRREESQLRLYVEKLNKVVERNTKEIREKNEMILNQLEYARAIQQSLLPPNTFEGSGGCKFEMGYFPCERLSGDFYDIFQVDEDNYVFYIMDVSGHGIPAALLTMVAKNAVSDFSGSMNRRERALHPDLMLADLYVEFNKLGLPDEIHFVIFYAVYNAKTRELTYSSGGINCAPILFEKNGGFSYLNESKGFPICKLGNLFEPKYSVYKRTIREGDILLLYTDGLVDFEKNRLFDEDTLIRLIEGNKTLDIKELGILMKNIITPGVDELNDDITYLIMRHD